MRIDSCVDPSPACGRRWNTRLTWARHCTGYTGRIERVLTEERAQLQPCDPDRAAVDGRYLERSVEQVVHEVNFACQRIAVVSRGLAADDLARSGIGSDGTRRTVEQLLARAVHELVHHERDLRSGLGQS